ncbi:MAG TPA: hypothetical protein VMV69_13605 [Pirellulales bacterium]|nr:hypothetical protein [Pirellulales bacterium]
MRHLILSSAIWLWLAALGLPAWSDEGQPGPPDTRAEEKDDQRDEGASVRPAARRDDGPREEDRGPGSGRRVGERDGQGAKRGPDGPPPPRGESNGRGKRDDGPGDRLDGPQSRDAGPRRGGPDGPPPRGTGRSRSRSGMPGGGGMMGGPRGNQNDPEMAKLEEADMDLDRKTHELAEQVRRAPDADDREELTKELTDTVDKHFEVRQERRELEIKRLEAQLERLRASLKKRMDERQAIVKQRISNLLGDDEIGF